MIKLSDYVIEFIEKLGVKHIFMLPGGGAMHLNDSIGKCQGIQYVCNLHEQSAAVAAEAYARISNHFGVACVTTGPGGTNAITGLAAAWLDSTPCIFLSGQVKRADMKGDKGVRMLGVQEIDIVSIVQPITKYAVTVTEPNQIRYHLEKAVSLAKTGRPGPVWLDIPLDVQAAMIDETNLTGYEPDSLPSINDGSGLDELIRKVITLLNQSSRPVILAGNGVRISGGAKAFLDLVDLLQIPVLTTRLGVDLIPASHPLCYGMPGSIASRGANYTLQNADFLLILGARLDMALIGYAPEKLAREAKKVMVNIDAAEINKIGPFIDIPVVADASRFIEGVLNRRDEVQSKDRSSWRKTCDNWKEKYPFVTKEHYQANEHVSVYAFSDMLAQELPEDCVILPGNAGNACEIFLTAFKAKTGQRIFHNKGTGAMGFSQPAAIGACLASGGKLTVCADGDGGFQLNIQELATIKNLGLPIKLFVLDNSGYASIRASQGNYFGRLTGADPSSGLPLPDILKIANAYGITTFQISSHQNMRGFIREVLNTPGPVICDVTIIPDEPRAPRVSSMQRSDGSMVSKPLEDMWPFLSREEFYSNMIVPPLEEE